MQLLIATRNRHKTEEIRAMLGAGFVVTDLSTQPGIPAIDETGSTFAENAGLKAVAVSRILPGLILADDSGLEVDALGGAPGVFSARYAGPQASDATNRAKLLRKLHECGAPEPWPARFRCVIVAAEGQVVATFEGAVAGTIISTERGESGFGYDPIFVPEGYLQTFGELSSCCKNALSHRSRALELLLSWLATSSYSAR